MANNPTTPTLLPRNSSHTGNLVISDFRGLALGMSFLLLACSSNQVCPGDAGASGDAPTARDATDSGDAAPSADVGVSRVPQPDGASLLVPAACQPPDEIVGAATTQPPYSVTFNFRNVGTTSLFRYLGCSTELEISSCASSYTDQLANRVHCSCSCEHLACPTCGACYDEAREVPPGGTVEETWYGTVPVSSTANGHSCQIWQPVPPGRYRVRLPFYNTAAEAKAHITPSLSAVADFILPHQSPGPVEIDVSL